MADGDSGFVLPLASREGKATEETRALIRISYKELDDRLSTLEREVTDLRSRLDKVQAKLAS